MSEIFNPNYNSLPKQVEINRRDIEELKSIIKQAYSTTFEYGDSTGIVTIPLTSTSIPQDTEVGAYDRYLITADGYLLETISISLDPQTDTKIVNAQMVANIKGPAGERGLPGEAGEPGPAGPPGPAGTSFQITGYAESVAELPAVGQIGDAYAVGSSDPKDIYVWVTSPQSEWVNLGNMQGPKGDNGADGITPNIAIAASITNTTGVPSVSVTKSGTLTDPIFGIRFENLKGAQGEPGEPGRQINKILSTKDKPSFISQTWRYQSMNDPAPSGYYCWTDGANLYYDHNFDHFMLTPNSNVFLPVEWEGLSEFSGNNIWTDGTNYYYSSSTDQYVLDIANKTLTPKTWNGLTSFAGGNVWSDGTNIYYSSSSTQYVLDVATSTWSTMSWTGLTSINGYNIWTDGTNIYYSNGANQYVLDIATSSWSAKTWNGLTNFYGESIWTNGYNIFYTRSNISRVLNAQTDTWNNVDWDVFIDLPDYNGANGRNVFNFNNHTYYFGVECFEYDVLNNKWLPKLWENLPTLSGQYVWSNGVFDMFWYKDYIGYQTQPLYWYKQTLPANAPSLLYGNFVWSDGTNFYYSNGVNEQFIIKIDESSPGTLKFIEKDWNGADIYGNQIWTDGIDIYYSFGEDQFVLNKSTGSWDIFEWNGFTELYGEAIWTDGQNIYYSYENEQYVLNIATHTWTIKTWNGYTNLIGNNIWSDGVNIYYSKDTNHYTLNTNTNTWTAISWTGLNNFNGEDIWINRYLNKTYYSGNTQKELRLCTAKTSLKP